MPSNRLQQRTPVISEVTTAINNQIKAGTPSNYTGHGNENGLAHERVVKEDIKSWNNSRRLPLFIVATCEFSRFDDIDINIITKKCQAEHQPVKWSF